MARNDWYTIIEQDDKFIIQKVDPDDRSPQTVKGSHNLPNQYEVGKEDGNKAMCSCFAGMKFCRHKQMIVKFNVEGKMSQRWLYNFDKNKWLPPLKQEV